MHSVLHPMQHMSKSVSTLFQIAPSGERQFAGWRTLLDYFVVVYIWIAIMLPASYWAVRWSACEDLAMADRQPFVDVVRGDPLLQTFPCGEVGNRSGGHAGPRLKLPSLLHTLKQEPDESVSWVLTQWWWVIPYIFTTYGCCHFVCLILFTPAFLLMPLLSHDWWIQGGRTLVHSALRCSCSLDTLLLMAATSHTSSSSPVGYTWMSERLLHVQMLRPVLGAVQWRLQVPISLMELAVVVLAVIQHIPGGHVLHICRVVFAAAAGTCLGLMVSYMETIILKLSTLPHVLSDDAQPLGPWNAVVVAVNKVHVMFREIVKKRDTLQVVGYVLMLLGCVVFLTIRDDIVIFI